jgi:mannose-6-phosphate isomerase
MAHPPFRLKPVYKHRVWGGDRLQPGETSTGEAWLVAPDCVVPCHDATLGDLAEECGPSLMGSLCAKSDTVVPILVKLLDTQDWLSVQVHPTDTLAREIEGSGHCGKTETWHILSAHDDAQLIAGLDRDHACDDFAAELRSGDPARHLRRMSVKAGDTIHIPAGMVHALGPGLLVYEVQQSSHLTYRGYDWDRPMTEGRTIDLDRFLQAFEAGREARILPLPGGRPLISVAEPPPYRLRIATTTAQLATGGESFHAVTAAGGPVTLHGGGWEETLAPTECLFVPANAGAYQIEPEFGARALIADMGA